MTAKERQRKKFTRRNLQQLSNWDLWDACFDKQLDANLADGTTGHPVLRPEHIDNQPANGLIV